MVGEIHVCVYFFILVTYINYGCTRPVGLANKPVYFLINITLPLGDVQTMMTEDVNIVLKK